MIILLKFLKSNLISWLIWYNIQAALVLISNFIALAYLKKKKNLIIFDKNSYNTNLITYLTVTFIKNNINHIINY